MFRIGKYADAISHATSALFQQQFFDAQLRSTIFLVRATAHLKLNCLDSAERDVNESLAIIPNESKCLRLLLFISKAKDAAYREAQKTKAAAVSALQSEYKRLRKTGQLAKGIELLRTGLKQFPGEWEILRDLGEAHRRRQWPNTSLEDMETADRYYSEAISEILKIRGRYGEDSTP